MDHQTAVSITSGSDHLAAALNAAARHRQRIVAVFSGGGRPELASAELPNVYAPVLLIVEGATQLFEEPGKLEQVAGLACDWFKQHLAAAAAAPQAPV
jgi:putative phosphoribosyl transferase